MSDAARKLAEKLAAEAEKTLAFFAPIEAEQWQAPIYSEGASWQVKQILAHFCSAEDSILHLVQRIAGGAAGVPQDFDLDAYNERMVAELQHSSPQALLALFAARRAATVAFVAGLEATDLAQQGRHPWLGQTSLEEMLKLLYRHNQLHQRDIRRALGV